MSPENFQHPMLAHLSLLHRSTLHSLSQVRHQQKWSSLGMAFLLKREALCKEWPSFFGWAIAIYKCLTKCMNCLKWERAFSCLDSAESDGGLPWGVLPQSGPVLSEESWVWGVMRETVLFHSENLAQLWGRWCVGIGLLKIRTGRRPCRSWADPGSWLWNDIMT